MEDVLRQVGNYQITENEATHFVGNTARYIKIDDSKLETFYIGYFDSVVNGVDPHVAEIVKNNVQLSFDLYFSFQKPKNDTARVLEDLEDDILSYMEYLVSIIQTQLTITFCLSKEETELVACILKPSGNFFVHQDQMVFTNLRCIFPYAFVQLDHAESFLTLVKYSMQFNSCREESTFTLPLLSPISNSIKNTNLKLRPLYGSTIKSNKAERLLEFSNAYGNMMSGKDDKTLSEIFFPGNHSAIREGNISDTSIEGYVQSYGLEALLPLFFSNQYYSKTLKLKEGVILPQPETTDQEVADKNSYQPFQSTLDKARLFISMLNPNRASIYWSWYDVGQSIFSTDSSEEGLTLWKEFTSSASTFTENDCNEKWEEFEDMHGVSKLMVTLDTLEYLAREDNPTFYQKHKSKEINDVLTRAAFDPTHRKVADAFKICYPFDFACAGFGKKIWYAFSKNRWYRIDADSSLRIRIGADFTNKLYLLKMEHDSQVSKTKDPQVKAHHKNIAENLNSLISKLEVDTFQNSVCSMLRSCYHKPSFSDWANSEWAYFCCLNGVIDMRGKRVVFRQGKPEDYNTLSGCKYPVNYTWDHPNVKEVMKYLQEVFTSPPLRNYVLLLCASYLHSGNINKIFTLFQGCGHNSKSMFVNLISYAFQDYLVKIKPEYFTEDKSDSNKPNPSISRAHGKKLMVTEEINKGTTFKEGTIKGLTGRDKQANRDLHQSGAEMKDVEPSYNIIYCVNTPPNIDDMNEAIWNRINKIPFLSQWRMPGNPEKPIPETYEEQLAKGIFKMETTFEERFPRMAPAFLWVLVQKYPEYLEKGLQQPKEVIEANREYQLNNNYYRRFITDTLKVAYKASSEVNSQGEKVQERDYNAYITLDETYREFKSWFMDQNMKIRIPSKQQFMEDMKQIFGPLEDKKWFGFRMDTKISELKSVISLIG